MKTAIATILCIFVGFFVYTKLVGPIPFSVNSVTTTKTNLFHVDGVGKATAVPDTALVSIGVTKTAPAVLDAQNQANTTANKVIDDFKKLGVEEKNIKTTNYSVYPNYENLSGKQTTNGYTVTQNLEVKIKPIDKANQAVDIATKDGANIVGGITFILDDNTKKQLEEKARREAVANAKDKAQSLANAAGLRLGRIVDVQESNGFEPRPVTMMAGGLEAKSADTQLQPGENTIQLTITLSYETY